MTLLNRHGMLNTSIIGKDTEEGFLNRLKLQKYTYLARYFGLNMEYPFTMYLHGPYSSPLADDYYNIEPWYDEDVGILPANFRESEFIDLVGTKDHEWLEVASTLISLNKSFKQRDKLLDRITNMKPYIRKERVNSVLSTLEEMKLLSF
jgi:uncharacterized protein YwgA